MQRRHMSDWNSGSRCADTSRSHSYSSRFHSDAGLPTHTGGVQAERRMMDTTNIERIDGPPQTSGAESIARLVSVSFSDHDLRILYNLLEERTPDQSISHKRMPTWAQHCAFVGSNPYEAWYLIFNRSATPVGSVYLTRQREIGVSIFRRYHRTGYGRAAVVEVMRRYPGRFLANVAPGNVASMRLWESLGGRQIQVTYEL